MRKGPFIIGLTGSIGMGKSAVAAMFQRWHVPVFDADAAVRMVQAPGGRALPLIAAEFPGVVREGVLDRQELGRRVFNDATARHRLESIVHPIVGDLRQAFLRRNHNHRQLLLDVPLLLEGEGWKMCDRVVVVSAPFRVQRGRVLRRPGMTEERFLAIVSNQMPDREKRRRADVVIETGRGRLWTWRSVSQLVRIGGKRACNKADSC